jgi:hypothetical protein
MKRPLLVLLVVAAMMFSATAATAGARPDGHRGNGHHTGTAWQLLRMRAANAQYHSPSKAIRDGFQALDVRGLGIGHITDELGLEGNPTCFDSPDGGMGVHYVDFSQVDDTVDPLHPEALVYEIGRNGRLRLVAVEYVASGETAPELFGRTFTWHKDIEVWKLHAWVYKYNPSGLFADWNPRVADCPS